MTANPPATDSLSTHFDQMSAGYDELIKRTFPPYLEVFETLFAFSDLDASKPLNILELGVGTGNLSIHAVQKYPKAHLTALDLSPEMLKVTEKKIKAHGIQDYTLVEAGFMDVDFPDHSFDLIMSSIALHHLTNDEKPLMYQRIFKWLKPGGKFRCIDGHQTLPANTAHPVIWQGWIDWAKPLGATDEEIAMWKAHEDTYDHFASLSEHFQWLNAAGFTHVDCYWKKLLWAIYGGEKA